MGKLRLAEIDTRAPKDLDKKEYKTRTESLVEELNALQNLLYAEHGHSVLVVLQGMDASGKDGLIRNVFGKMNPQGVSVRSYKAPTEEELSHDFLWRIHKHTPEKGMIKIFNRSHYEDIIITRVHKWCDDETAIKRMKAINDFESLLQSHNNTSILKFYLHISQEEQESRLKERLEDPTKHWKHNKNDQKEAQYWNDYRKMYEECFAECNQPEWTIVPADQNWYKEYLVAKKLRDVLVELEMKYPTLQDK